MMAEALISFRKYFWTNDFPIEAQFYDFGGSEGLCTHMSQIIHSQDRLREFQDELTRRESTGEWVFLAYYEHTPSA
jgi:hypothetical protein